MLPYFMSNVPIFFFFFKDRFSFIFPKLNAQLVIGKLVTYVKNFLVLFLFDLDLYVDIASMYRLHIDSFFWPSLFML